MKYSFCLLFSLLYFIFFRAMSFHFWYLNNFMFFHGETITINANKANKKREHYNCRNIDNVYHTVNTWLHATSYKYIQKRKNRFAYFNFSFLYMLCIIVLMLFNFNVISISNQEIGARHTFFIHCIYLPRKSYCIFMNLNYQDKDTCFEFF